MPRKSLDPGAQPFEFKVGVGISHLGGMYRLGDPSMCPPNRFRYLQNVRLGGKDVRARPGMAEAADTTSGESVKGITEIPPARLPISVWLGPLANIKASLTQTLSETFLYQSLDNTWQQPPINWTPPLWEDLYRGTVQHISGPAYISGLSPNPYSQTLEPLGFEEIAPCGRLPFLEAQSSNGTNGDIRHLGTYRLDPGAQAPRDDMCNWTVRKELAPGSNLDEFFMTERIAPVCADVIVRFNDIWLAAGNYRADQNPGAIGTEKALNSGLSDNTGQPVYEVVFDLERIYDPWEGLDPEDPDYLAKPEYQTLRPGGLREVFRMPGELTEVIPDRAAGGAPGTLIRSMRAWSERQDDPLTGEVQTGSVLYIGTNGGHPLIAGVPPNSWPHATQDAGAVYSFDGTTVKKEDISPSALGQMVMVEVLPDGGVIAVGRTGGAFRDPNTGTWTNVLWSPTFYQKGFAHTPAYVSQDYGFMWMDRLVFQGEAYFVGFDVRRLGQETAGGFWNGPENYGLPNPPTYIHPENNLVVLPISDPEDYRQPRAWVLYKYDRLSNTMVLVRSGDDIATALGMTAAPIPGGTAPDWGPRAPDTTLATDGYRLYYTHYWLNTAGGNKDPNGPGLHFGTFDGSIFEDNFIDRSILPGGGWGEVKSMIGHEDGVLVLMAHTLWRFSYGTKVLDPVWEETIGGQPGMPHNGLNGREQWSMDETLFFGPK